VNTRASVSTHMGTTTLVSAAVVAAFLTGFLLMSGSQGAVSQQPSLSIGSVVDPFFRPVTTYSSLDALTAASDLVAVATVVEVKPGRLAGDPLDGAEGQVQFYDVVLKIDDLLAGSADTFIQPGQIQFETLLIPGSPIGSFPNADSAWWQSGASSLFFLRADSTVEGREWVLASAEGVQYLQYGRGGILTAAGTEPIEGLEAATVEDVRATLPARANS